MRRFFYATLMVGAFTLATGATYAQALKHVGRAPVAVSADRYAMDASYTASEHGYSPEARHITDCLATYANSYDLRTDRVEISPGVSQRCAL